jgi:IDEAL domain
MVIMATIRKSFQVGDRVKLKEDLREGRIYHSYKMPYHGDSFVDEMKELMDKAGGEATIVEITELDGYILDIDEHYAFYDEMLDYATASDEFSQEEYKFHPDVESLLAHMDKNLIKLQIDKALDENDEAEFLRLTELAKLYR